jgi:hypothetical protein
MAARALAEAGAPSQAGRARETHTRGRVRMKTYRDAPNSEVSFPPTVYASCSASPPPHATLASRRPATALPGPDLHRLITPAWPGAFLHSMMPALSHSRISSLLK